MFGLGTSMSPGCLIGHLQHCNTKFIASKVIPKWFRISEKRNKRKNYDKSIIPLKDED